MWALLLCAAALAAAAPSPSSVLSFGAGKPGFSLCEAPTVILSHNLTQAAFGVMTHFWVTGGSVDDIFVSYFIDGEAEASIVFSPAMACGQGFPADMASDPVSTGGLYHAGAKMGKAAPQGGWYHYYKIPFYASVVVTAATQPGRGCTSAYMIVRGHEGGPPVSLPSGLTLPAGAKMILLSISGVTYPPLAAVALANVSMGLSGVVYQTTIATSTQPSGNNYIEGCWHLLRQGDEPWPGLILGTGFEDMFDSAYWFGAASGYPDGVMFQHPGSGLTHFTRVNNVEQLSAYRFFDEEIVGFTSGGRLLWRVGDQTTKCGANSTDGPIGTPSSVTVTSHTWLYVWPNGGPVTPLPPLPPFSPPHMSYACSGTACVPVADTSGPYWTADCDSACVPGPVPSPVPGPPHTVGCADGTCDAFCDVATVRGCVAVWSGSLSMRAPVTGKGPCGGVTPCASPADACAPGWAVCLSNLTVSPLSLPSFRNAITADQCGAADPRRFVGGMQHADPAWESLPPQPCPPTPQDTDNGCSSSGWGAEPVCCGVGCLVPSCPNDVWPAATRIHAGEGEGCGSVSSNWVDGVLCCKVE